MNTVSTFVVPQPQAFSNLRVRPDPFVALLAVLAIGMPAVQLGDFAGRYDSQRLAVLLLFFVGTCTLWTPPGRRALTGVAWNPLAALAFAASIALGVASAARAALPLYGLTEVGQVVVLAGMAALVAGRLTGVEGRQTVEWLVLAAAATYAVAVYVPHGVDLWAGGEGWPRGTTGAFANPRFFNQAQLVMLPVLLGISARPGVGTGGRWAARALAALHVGAMMASGGRAAMVGLGIGLVVAVVISRRRSRPLVREAAVAVGLGILIFGVLFSGTAPATGFHDKGTSMNGRDVLFAAAIRMAAEHPGLGVGPMHFAYVATNVSAHPHNIVLQLAAEWGVPAAMLLLAVATFGIVAFLQGLLRAGAERSGWHATLAVALVASAVNSLFDSAAMVPLAQVWTVVLVAAVWAEGSRRRTSVGSPGGRAVPPFRWILPIVVAVSLLPALTVAVRDAPSLDRRASQRSSWMRQDYAHPRFWQFGSIAPPSGPPTSAGRYWETP